LDRLDEDCTYRNYEVGLKLGHSWIVGPNFGGNNTLRVATS